MTHSPLNQIMNFAMALIASFIFSVAQPATAQDNTDNDKNRVEVRVEEHRVITHEAPSTTPTYTTYLGVAATALPPELAAHLDIPAGQGLILQFIAPDSPAQKAGLATHDILLQLDDQQLINMPQLQSLIQGRQPGETVKVKFIHAGQTKTANIKLAKRLTSTQSTHEMPMRQLHEKMMQLRQRQGEISPQHQPADADQTPYINTERITRELKELSEKIKAHSSELATELKALTEEATQEAARQSKIIAERAMVEAKQLMEQVEKQQKIMMKRIEEEQKAHAARQSVTSSAEAFTHTKTDRRESAVYHDGTHRLTYTIDADGKKTLKVTQDEKVIFEGPANTPKQLKKLPPAVLKKFEKLQSIIAKKTDANASE